MDVRYYIDLVKTALRNIEAKYFNLATTYEPSGIVRERVFCYEFYHQMRLLMTEGFPLSLNGEIDKRGHRDFKIEHRKNPDFVFHIPGTHVGNTVVIEVKGRLDYDQGEIPDDFSKMLTFINDYGYQAGIFVVYNHSFAELLESHGVALKEMSLQPGAEVIYIVAISSATQEPEEIVLASLR